MNANRVTGRNKRAQQLLEHRKPSETFKEGRGWSPRPFTSVGNMNALGTTLRAIAVFFLQKTSLEV